MKPVGFYLPLAVMITVMACSKSSSVDRELTIPLGECRTVSGALLCYDSLNDSRCPRDGKVYCYWAGIGVGHFTLDVNKQKHNLTLATYDFGPWRTDTTVAGYTIEVLELNPFPTSTAPQPNVWKTAKVWVKKL